MKIYKFVIAFCAMASAFVALGQNVDSAILEGAQTQNLSEEELLKISIAQGLLPESEIEEVVVSSTIGGNFIKQSAMAKEENISFAGLCKMACCTLAESFENSASVTVGYSDAISGARQIQMLGLAGRYTQILDESRPIMRGLSSPYGLSYTPGMWLNSIQVSKGISSVTSGHEAITGQINLEYRKPTDEERLFLNLYLNNELRGEMNLSSATKIGKSGKLSMITLAHASYDSDLRELDHNSDGFRDMPATQQFSLANRWSYLASSGIQLRWGLKLLAEERLGGMYDFEEEERSQMYENNIYGSKIQNKNAGLYFKIGAPLGSMLVDSLSGDSFQSNIALVADVDYYKQDSYFGLNDYSGEEQAFALNAMYQHFFSPRSSAKMGISSRLSDIDEVLNNPRPWAALSLAEDLSYLARTEKEVGVFGEYTYNFKEDFSLIAGLRGDYDARFDNFRVSPRGQFKWNILKQTTLRASAGLGHRTSDFISDNIGILASGREIIIPQMNESFNPVERALTFGGSLTQRFRLLRASDATISVDYFRTEFSSSVIVDQEWDSETIRIYSSTEPATTDTYQVDFAWKPSERFDIFATYRYTSSKVTLSRPDGSLYQTERPLVAKEKALLNLQYATHMRRWVFDATAQYNGRSRLPVQDGNIAQAEYSPSYPMFFAQVSRRLGAWEIYAGCENIANYMQDEPIISADDPFSSEFNSTVVWGPLMGRKFYIGARFNLY